jgi:hypothetical protein
MYQANAALDFGVVACGQPPTSVEVGVELQVGCWSAVVRREVHCHATEYRQPVRREPIRVHGGARLPVLDATP